MAASKVGTEAASKVDMEANAAGVEVGSVVVAAGALVEAREVVAAKRVEGGAVVVGTATGAAAAARAAGVGRAVGERVPCIRLAVCPGR